MKKLPVFVALIGLVACASSCNGAKYDNYFKPHRGEWASTYRSLRLNGIGYNFEQYSKILDMEAEKEYYAVTKVKALVVPVDFLDYPASSLPKGEEGTKEELYTAVFGNAEDTSWQSLRSYYDSVSYGQCKISGTVTDWFHTNITTTQFAGGKNFGPNKEYTGATKENATQQLAKAIEKEYFGPGKLNMDDYDANKDGAIDSIIMIYSAPHHSVAGSNVDQDTFWAYCWSVNGATGGAYRYFWCSYYFFLEGQEDVADPKLNCRTLIHEFGHVIGAPDYYDTDYRNNPDGKQYSPLGGVDMMDHNIGDHNSFTKGIYGWTAPYIVDGDANITINSTTDTGDYVIIPMPGKWYDRDDTSNRWDGTLLDQYLMIEFVTPTGVCEADSKVSQNGFGDYWFSNAGFRVTHVDARLGMWDYDGNFKNYTIKTSSGSGYYINFAADNSGSRCAFKYGNDRLISVVSATGNPWKSRGNASVKNEDLFYEGGVIEDFYFFNRAGKQEDLLPYKITFGKINGTESASIQIRVVK